MSKGGLRRPPKVFGSPIAVRRSATRDPNTLPLNPRSLRRSKFGSARRPLFSGYCWISPACFGRAALQLGRDSSMVFTMVRSLFAVKGLLMYITDPDSDPSAIAWPPPFAVRYLTRSSLCRRSCMFVVQYLHPLIFVRIL